MADYSELGQAGAELESIVVGVVGNALPYINTLNTTLNFTQRWAGKVNHILADHLFENYEYKTWIDALDVSSSIIRGVTAAAIGLAAAGVVIVASWHKAAGAIREAVDHAQELGSSVRDITAWETAMYRVGGASQSVASNLRSLESSIQQAARQPITSLVGLMSGTTGDLHRIGLTPRQLAGLPIRRQLELIADGLLRVRNEQQRLLIANNLFAGNGAAWLRILEGGAGALKNLDAQAELLNVNLSERQSEAVRSAVIQLARFKTAMYGIAVQITGSIAPSVELLARVITDAAIAIGFVIKMLDRLSTIPGLPFLTKLQQYFLNPLGKVIEALEAIFNWLGDKMPSLFGGSSTGTEDDPIARWQRASGLQVTGNQSAGIGTLVANSSVQTGIQQAMLNELRQNSSPRQTYSVY